MYLSGPRNVPIRYLESESQNGGGFKSAVVFGFLIVGDSKMCVCQCVYISISSWVCVSVHRMTEGHTEDELANIISLSLIGRLPWSADSRHDMANFLGSEQSLVNDGQKLLKTRRC